MHDRIGTCLLQIEIPFNQQPQWQDADLVEFVRVYNQFLLLEQCKLRQTVTLMLVDLWIAGYDGL